MPTDLPPLSDNELSLLDAFLLSDSCDVDTLSLDEVHGYLTAIQLSHAGDIPWQETVWGQPRFPDQSLQAQMTELLERFNAEICDELHKGRDFEPLSVEEEDGEVLSHAGWCYGFMLGMEQTQEYWDTLPKGLQALLVPIAQIALLHDDEEEIDMDEDEYNDWVELIPGAISGLFHYRNN